MILQHLGLKYSLALLVTIGVAVLFSTGSNAQAASQYCNEDFLRPYFGAAAAEAARICQAESGGNPFAVNGSCATGAVPPGAQPELSVGLFQMNLLAHTGATCIPGKPIEQQSAETKKLIDEYQNPTFNAQMAASLQNAGGWCHWTTAGRCMENLCDNPSHPVHNLSCSLSGGAGGASGGVLFLLSESGQVPRASDIKLNLELDWPSLPGVGTSLNDLVEGNATIYLQNIINFIFALSLWIGAVVAFVSVVYAGFTYIISGANPQERGRAIEGIKNVSIGVMILLGSVIFLNLINPNLAQLGVSLSLDEGATTLLAPSAPTASGGLRKNTTDHAYAPIPFTDRTGAEDSFAGLAAPSSAVVDCLAQADTKTDEDKCNETYAKEVARRFQTQGAVIVWDDDETQTSCAAVCMKLSGGDPLNCRQYGSGDTDDNALDGGAAAIWNKLQQEEWQRDSDNFYRTKGSAYDTWLKDDAGVPGDEDIESRQCLASYVEEASDAPGDFGWDACFCKT